MTDYYSSKEASHLSGATIPQLEHLVQTGAIRPVREGYRGHGGSRLFDLRNLVEAKIAAQLLEHGVPVRAIRHIVDGIRSGFNFAGRELARKVLVVERGPHSEAFGPWASRVYLEPESLPTWLRQGGSGIVVNIPAILDTIEQATGRRVLEETAQ